MVQSVHIDRFIRYLMTRLPSEPLPTPGMTLLGATPADLFDDDSLAGLLLGDCLVGGPGHSP